MEAWHTNSENSHGYYPGEVESCNIIIIIFLTHSFLVTAIQIQEVIIS